MRLRTARGVAEEEVAFFIDLNAVTHVALSYVDDLDVWHEALVTWPSLGVDRAAAILTPDEDHHVELMAGASAGPLWIGVRDSGAACVSNRCRSRPNGNQLSLASLRKDDACSRLTIRGRYFLDAEGRQRSFPIVELAERVGVAASRSEVDCKHSLGVEPTLSMTISDAPWRPLLCCMRLVIRVSVVVALSCDVSQFKMLENSAARCWRSWVLPTLASKPCSTEDFSEQITHEATTRQAKRPEASIS